MKYWKSMEIPNSAICFFKLCSLSLITVLQIFLYCVPWVKFRKMKLNDRIKVFKFGIEKVWKMFFANVWIPSSVIASVWCLQQGDLKTFAMEAEESSLVAVVILQFQLISFAAFPPRDLITFASTYSTSTPRRSKRSRRTSLISTTT